MIFSNKNIIFDKIVNRVLLKKNLIWRYIDPEKLAKKLYAKSRDSLVTRLKEITGEFSKCQLDKLTLSDRKAIIDSADHTLNHEFNILGSGWTKIEPLDWTSDFIHKFSWEKRNFYKNYELVSSQGGRDIKVVWDLSRGQHLLWLGEAYLLTKNRRYGEEIICQINNWIEQNPLMYSINWTCSMDVAIRAVHWIYALSMISQSGLINHEFADKIEISLFEHLFFIINNLEKSIPNSGNHYLSDLVGILFLSNLFPKNRFAKFCHKFALKEFYREAVRELNEDGSNYENSISYHRLVTELFLYTYSLLVRRGEIIPQEVSTRIWRASNYISAYIMPNGAAPQIGDNDNGRFLPFVPREYRGHNYLVEVGKLIFSNDGEAENYGESLFAMLQQSSFKGVPTELTIYKSGIVIASNSLAKLIVTNGGFSSDRANNIGEWGGTHTHCDNLSFVLSVRGKEIIVDPGTYVYTSDPLKRKLLRSTYSHSTVMIDGVNQSEFHATNMFTMKQRITDRRLDVREDGDRYVIKGYYKFDNGNLRYEHSREFILVENQLTIMDQIISDGSHELSLFYILPPEVRIKSREALIVTNGDSEVSIEVEESKGNKLKPAIEAQAYSPSYGKLEQGSKIVYRSIFQDRIIINSVLTGI